MRIQARHAAALFQFAEKLLQGMLGAALVEPHIAEGRHLDYEGICTAQRIHRFQAPGDILCEKLGKLLAERYDSLLVSLPGNDEITFTQVNEWKLQSDDLVKT